MKNEKKWFLFVLFILITSLSVCFRYAYRAGHEKGFSSASKNTKMEIKKSYDSGYTAGTKYATILERKKCKDEKAESEDAHTTEIAALEKEYNQKLMSSATRYLNIKRQYQEKKEEVRKLEDELEQRPKPSSQPHWLIPLLVGAFLVAIVERLFKVLGG